MRKKIFAVILFLLVIISGIVFGDEINKPKPHKTNKKHSHIKEKFNNERIKRSLNDEENKPFWANRGKKKIESPNLNANRYDFDIEKASTLLNSRDNFDKEPFWGMRGRRETVTADDYIGDDNQEYTEDSTCKNCYGTVHFNSDDKNFKNRRDENLEPFWGNRGKRESDEIEDSNDPFWGNRGKKQDDEPFWGTRGRRKESPFWGARGRREDEPFWGNRGRRDDEPFWSNRGRRSESEPFWGNRGRRQESEPFWGNRGRRDDEPFWGNRGRRKEADPFWGNRGRRKEDLKESILNAINVVENDIEHLSRLKRGDPNSFWSNRGRDSKLKYLFNTPARNKFIPQLEDMNLILKADPSAIQDSRIFAEEPHYVIVQRSSSRSSAEAEDPYYISRGKKYYVNYSLMKAARDRRGAIEEIVKSVRNDPYYIARGKKDTDMSAGAQASTVNSTFEDDYLKAKELVCSTIGLITAKQHNGKVKREIDSDRERRTILKKLAAQLQIDPYYVSRGKKSDGNANGNNLREFITEVTEKCN